MTKKSHRWPEAERINAIISHHGYIMVALDLHQERRITLKAIASNDDNVASLDRYLTRYLGIFFGFQFFKTCRNDRKPFFFELETTRSK